MCYHTQEKSTSMLDIDILLALKEAVERTGRTKALMLANRRLNEIAKLSPQEFEDLIAPLYRILR